MCAVLTAVRDLTLPERIGHGYQLCSGVHEADDATKSASSKRSDDLALFAKLSEKDSENAPTFSSDD